MLFNSLQFGALLAVVFVVHYCVRDRYRWVVLLAGSVVFYAALRAPHLLVALGLVIGVAYGAGRAIAHSPSERWKRLLFGLGSLALVAVLVYWRYLPFLASNLGALVKLTGAGWAVPVPEPLVAVGVSFYVFQAISYLYDVYLEREEPERHLGYFALYLALFPKLLQGPIERAGDLLPQLRRPYEFSYDAARASLFLFAVGLFKKVVIADRLGLLVDPIYQDVHHHTGLPLIMATYAYAFQIYFDFSGYTDMALGAAGLLGLQLTNNFNAPYLATSIADFWRRWHITFSRWLLDYLFKPLQLSWRDARVWGTAGALLVTFLVSGLWHGAEWHFVAWGALHGVYLAGAVLLAPVVKRLYRSLRLEKTRALRVWQVVATFHLVCLAWIFFRANSIGDAWYVVTHLFTGVGGQLASVGASGYLPAVSSPALGDVARAWEPGRVALLVCLAVILEALQAASRESRRRPLLRQPAWVRWPAYYALVALVLTCGHHERSTFIYFDF